MAYNDKVIEALRRGFEEWNGKYTNCALVFAYNGTGKTRLSYDFAHYGRQDGDKQHTLYYNAYTEDLFTWDNDIENNEKPCLNINQDAALIRGLAGYQFEESLRKYLSPFTDIDFSFQYSDKGDGEIPQSVEFSKNIVHKQYLNGEWIPFEDKVENIKISRGEERLFVWCFFRCIIDQVLGGNDAYKDIEYIYIDDPMSSLDDNNVIAFGQQLYSVIRQRKRQEQEDMLASREVRRINFVISTHHALFYHIMLHGLNGDDRLGRYYLSRNKEKDRPVLKKMSDETPFYYNVAMMSEVKKAIEKDKLYTYHFTVMRSVMEKIRDFFGQRDFKYILEGITYKGEALDDEQMSDYYSRVVNVLTHQGSMFTPTLMNEDNIELATTLFNHLVKKYNFVLPDLDDYRSEKVLADEANKTNKTKTK